MGSSYTHLTESERYHVYTLQKQGQSLRSIAQGMGRHHTTLSREIARNTGGKGYRYKQAQRFAETRHKTKPKARKWNPDLEAYVVDKIGSGPEMLMNINTATSINWWVPWYFL